MYQFVDWLVVGLLWTCRCVFTYNYCVIQDKTRRKSFEITLIPDCPFPNRISQDMAGHHQSRRSKINSKAWKNPILAILNAEIDERFQEMKMTEWISQSQRPELLRRLVIGQNLHRPHMSASLGLVRPHPIIRDIIFGFIFSPSFRLFHGGRKEEEEEGN